MGNWREQKWTDISSGPRNHRPLQGQQRPLAFRRGGSTCRHGLLDRLLISGLCRGQRGRVRAWARPWSLVRKQLGHHLCAVSGSCGPTTPDIPSSNANGFFVATDMLTGPFSVVSRSGLGRRAQRGRRRVFFFHTRPPKWGCHGVFWNCTVAKTYISGQIPCSSATQNTQVSGAGAGSPSRSLTVLQSQKSIFPMARPPSGRGRPRTGRP